jgi:2-hydroxy-3-keto-5-methylthiopentenyl-1-phosphate phosphatase
VRPALFCDFDGTITETDTLVMLLDRFGQPLPDGRDWRVIEDDPQLPERVKLQAELDLLTVGEEEALAWLAERVRLREGFLPFVRALEAAGLPLTILSGGLLPILEQTLAPLGLGNLRLLANGLRVEQGRWIALPATSPRINGLCNHCKTWHLEQAAPQPLVYIGDGSTDFCPGRRADLVFARESLGEHLSALGRDFHPFDTFDTVHQALAEQGWLDEPFHFRGD